MTNLTHGSYLRTHSRRQPTNSTSGFISFIKLVATIAGILVIAILVEMV